MHLLNSVIRVANSNICILKSAKFNLLMAAFHKTTPVNGFEEFFEPKKPNEAVIIGRGWTVPDLRRKSFEDLHKLWYVLYKERNVLLTDKERRRRMLRPTTKEDELRYNSVKRSMAGIKAVLGERRRIEELIQKEKEKETKQ